MGVPGYHILSACFRPTALIRRIFKCGKFARRKTRCKKFGGNICPPVVRQSLTDIIMMVYLAMAFFCGLFSVQTESKESLQFQNLSEIHPSYRPPKLSQVWCSHIFHKGRSKKPHISIFPHSGANLLRIFFGAAGSFS